MFKKKCLICLFGCSNEHSGAVPIFLRFLRHFVLFLIGLRVNTFVCFGLACALGSSALRCGCRSVCLTKFVGFMWPTKMIFFFLLLVNMLPALVISDFIKKNHWAMSKTELICAIVQEKLTIAGSFS